MNKRNIAIIGLGNSDLKLLKAKYKKINIINLKDKISKKKIYNVEAFIVYKEWPIRKYLNQFIKKDFINFKKLRWFHLSRAGVDSLLPNINKYKFKITCGKGLNNVNSSEHALAMLLFLTRNLNNHKNPHTEINGKKVLIVGLGGIGSSLARRLSFLGADVSGVVNYNKKKYNFLNKCYYQTELPNIISKFDILINIVPLTKKTFGMFNSKIFNKMKKGVYFVSISRDGTIEMDHLKKYFYQKKFSGLGIDFTEYENKKKFDSMIKKENIIFTNHSAGKSDSFKNRLDLIIKNLDHFLKKRKLKNIVSIEKQY